MTRHDCVTPGVKVVLPAEVGVQLEAGVRVPEPRHVSDFDIACFLISLKLMSRHHQNCRTQFTCLPVAPAHHGSAVHHAAVVVGAVVGQRGQGPPAAAGLGPDLHLTLGKLLAGTLSRFTEPLCRRDIRSLRQSAQRHCSLQPETVLLWL